MKKYFFKIFPLIVMEISFVTALAQIFPDEEYDYTNFQGEDFSDFILNNSWPNVEILNLSSIGFGAWKSSYLAKAYHNRGNFPKLTKLILNNNNVTCDALGWIANIRTIEILSLQNNKITNVAVLKALHNLDYLKEVDLRYNPISRNEKAKIELSCAFRGVKFIYDD